MMCAKGYAGAVNAARWLLRWVCLGALSCSGSSREPSSDATGGQVGAMATQGGSGGAAVLACLGQ
jgi:hypothetical protein